MVDSDDDLNAALEKQPQQPADETHVDADFRAPVDLVAETSDGDTRPAPIPYDGNIRRAQNMRAHVNESEDDGFQATERIRRRPGIASVLAGVEQRAILESSTVDAVGTAAGAGAASGAIEVAPAEAEPFRASLTDLPAPSNLSAVGGSFEQRGTPLPLVAEEAERQAAAAIADSNGAPILDSEGKPLAGTALTPPAGELRLTGHASDVTESDDREPGPSVDDPVQEVPGNTVALTAEVRSGVSGIGGLALAGVSFGSSTVDQPPTAAGYGQDGFGAGPFGGSVTAPPPDTLGDDAEHREPRVFSVSVSEEAQAVASVDARVIRAPPEVPPQRSAAIQPVWVEDRLVVPSGPAASDLPGESVLVAFGAARIGLQRAIDDLTGAAGNFDPRLVAFAKALVAAIPTALPDQLTVFILGQEVEAFQRLISLAVAEQSLSAVQAARLEAAARQLERCADQFPAWRDFKRNAAAADLTAEQISAAPRLALALAEQFETDEAREIIDESVPNALRVLARPMGGPSALGEASSPTIDVPAVDMIESLGNILKKLAERAIGGTAVAGRVTGQAAQAVGDAIGKGLLKGFEKVGEAVPVWCMRLLIGDLVLHQIVTRYPALSSLQPILEHLLALLK